MRKWKFTHALYLKSNAVLYFGDLKNTAYSVNSRRACSIWWDGSRLQDLMIWHFDKIPKISVTTGYMLWFFHQFKHWPSQPGHTSWFHFTFWYISYRAQEIAGTDRKTFPPLVLVALPAVWPFLPRLVGIVDCVRRERKPVTWYDNSWTNLLGSDRRDYLVQWSF